MPTKRHIKIRQLAKRLNDGTETDNDRRYLADCLHEISLGRDANEAFDVKTQRGQNHDKQIKHVNICLALTWVADAIQPETDRIDTGLDLPLEDALGEAAERFKVSYETLRRCWGLKKYKQFTSGTFNSMAELYPD